MTQPETPTPAARTQGQVVGILVAELNRESFGTGPLAELRRMDPKQAAPGQPALHRLLARYVPDGWLHGEAMNRWTLLVHLLALAAPDLNHGDQPLGTALFLARYSEGRLTRLLEARSEEFPVVLPRMVRFLVAKHASLHPYQLATLVLHGGAEADRLRLARDYYRAEARQPNAA